MAINMTGSWTISVKAKDADFPQRFIIAGATTGNGTYAGEISTPPVEVTGDNWSVTIQNDRGAGFVDSAERVTPITVSGTRRRFDIESDDAFGDQDFNDLILTAETKAEVSAVPCCPPLDLDQVCDVLDYHYRQLYKTPVAVDNRRRNVQVEVILHVRIERCPGPLTLGDLLYSTTLLPGEKVRLFSQDRRSRFSFDSASRQSFRNEQTSEERFYMSSFSSFMSDLTVRDSARATNTLRGHFDTHGETSGAIESFFSGPSIDVSGNYNSSATSTFLRQLSQHAQASHHRAEMGTRAASSVSIGEVQRRTHTQGESEDHFESASREFSNPNKCHAVTFFFYQINKTQLVRVKLESIERRVIDPAVDTRVTNNPFVSRGGVSAVPTTILATDAKRLELEKTGRDSVTAGQSADGVGLDLATAATAGILLKAVARVDDEPMPDADRAQALKQVDEQLVAAKLLDRVGGKVTAETQREFSFEIRSSLPTPGLLVKGCLDECDVCEPAVLTASELNLERKQLENELLARQIALLDKSQEYRCCPSNEETPPSES